jgi:hypothetical protein
MEDRKSGTWLVGFAAFGALMTGGIGLLAAVVSFLGGDRVSAGIFIIGAALAFGLLVNAALRD